MPEDPEKDIVVQHDWPALEEGRPDLRSTDGVHQFLSGPSGINAVAPEVAPPKHLLLDQVQGGDAHQHFCSYFLSNLFRRQPLWKVGCSLGPRHRLGRHHLPQVQFAVGTHVRSLLVHHARADLPEVKLPRLRISFPWAEFHHQDVEHFPLGRGEAQHVLAALLLSKGLRDLLQSPHPLGEISPLACQQSEVMGLVVRFLPALPIEVRILRSLQGFSGRGCCFGPLGSFPRPPRLPQCVFDAVVHLSLLSLTLAQVGLLCLSGSLHELLLLLMAVSQEALPEVILVFALGVLLLVLHLKIGHFECLEVRFLFLLPFLTPFPGELPIEQLLDGLIVVHDDLAVAPSVPPCVDFLGCHPQGLLLRAFRPFLLGPFLSGLVPQACCTALFEEVARAVLQDVVQLFLVQVLLAGLPHNHVLQHKLVLSPLHHALLHGGPGHQPVCHHFPLLTHPVGARLRLQVIVGIEVRIEDDDRVRGCKVDSQPPGLGRKQEDRDRLVLVERFDPRLSLSPTHPAVKAHEFDLPPFQPLLKKVQHRGELGEDEDPVPALQQLGSHLVEERQLPRRLDEALHSSFPFQVPAQRLSHVLFKHVRMVAALAQLHQDVLAHCTPPPPRGQGIEVLDQDGLVKLLLHGAQLHAHELLPLRGQLL
mmetsp:Transcript_27821/g.77814  ORF Transcript_27821/g.77814 Transcript_27821/m.77814 type:complete len:647 (+) Transcript_27821:651-2591(+)